MSGELPRDENHVVVLGAVSSADATVVIPLKADPVTKRLLVEGAVTGPTGYTGFTGMFTYSLHGELNELLVKPV